MARLRRHFVIAGDCCAATALSWVLQTMIAMAFGGVTYLAAAGLDAAQAESALGFTVGGGDVHGALSSDGLQESDLQAGLYDDASVEIWLVNWSDIRQRILLDAATIGEVRRSDYVFVAELRSIAHRFDQTQGAQFQRGCAADIGDKRCGLILDTSNFSGMGTILSTERPGAFLVSLDTSFASGFFTNGALSTSVNGTLGPRLPIKTHETTSSGHRIVLWSAPQIALGANARIKLFAGCDKSPETCKNKFNNIVNFRGFPHLPGNDVVMNYPNANGIAMDGGSLFR